MNSLPEHLRRLRKMLHSPQASEAAWAILENYFNCVFPDDIREELQLLKEGLHPPRVPHMDLSTTKKEELTFFLAYTQLVMEAMYVLHVHFQCLHLPMRLWQRTPEMN